MSPVSSVRTSAVLSLALVASACAHNPYRGLAPGEPVSVVPVMRTVPVTRDTEIRDATGARIGMESTVIGTREVVDGFRFERGGERIDEQDYYHLAGDQAAFDQVARARARGIRRNRLGLALMGLGTAAAIGVPVMFGRGAAPYAVGQWFISFPIGLGLTFFGRKPFEQPVLPATRAFDAIHQAPPSWVGDLD